MQWRSIKRGVLALSLMAALAVGTMYTWDGGASGNWDGRNVWDPQSFVCAYTCHPNSTDDDAVIDTDDVTITLTKSVTIDDLTFSGSGASEMIVESDNTNRYRVTTDSISISGTSVQLKDLASLRTE